MKPVIVALGLSLACAAAFAAPKPCEELKSEIAAKLDAKGVKNYQMDIVAVAEIKDQTVIGSCAAGTKKITYTRGGKAAAKAAPKADGAAKPATAATPAAAAKPAAAPQSH